MIRSTYEQSAKIQDAFTVAAMTRNWVVSEGPCGGTGCNGGILEQQPPDDLADLVPGLKGYDAENTSVIWLYQVNPKLVTRHNNMFGDDTVRIHGSLTNNQKLYFAVVPRAAVEPRLQWVYVATP